MSTPRNDLTGRRFAHWEVIQYAGKQGEKHFWKCRCQCGTVKNVRGTHLTCGDTISCGCYRDAAATTHGMSKTREYLSWSCAKGRTTNPNNTKWKHYGGRGITMCDRWRNSFESFFKDMGPCPPGYEIERKNVNGHYEPGNCCWIDSALQSKNRTNNVILTSQGKTQHQQAWSKETGIPQQTIRQRLQRGWNVEDALHTPPRHIASNNPTLG